MDGRMGAGNQQYIQLYRVLYLLRGSSSSAMLLWLLVALMAPMVLAAVFRIKRPYKTWLKAAARFTHQSGAAVRNPFPAEIRNLFPHWEVWVRGEHDASAATATPSNAVSHCHTADDVDSSSHGSGSQER